MLRDVEGAEILLYHCCAPFSEVTDEQELEELKAIGKRYEEQKREKLSHFFEKARGALIELGIDKEMIHTQFYYDYSLTDKKVSKTILSDAKKEKIGTIVMGRKGSTRAREFRLGSVCQRTLSEARGCTLWIV